MSPEALVRENLSFAFLRPGIMSQRHPSAERRTVGSRLREAAWIPPAVDSMRANSAGLVRVEDVQREGT